MDYQSVPMLGATNFHEWRDKVKFELIACGRVWKLVCDGYYKTPPLPKNNSGMLRQNVLCLTIFIIKILIE